MQTLPRRPSSARIRAARLLSACLLVSSSRDTEAIAATSDAGQPFQLGQTADFAGGVARERQCEVVRMDACAVVGYADESDAAAGQLYMNVCGACVEAVFDDFFERGGGALYHFACGDLVDKVVGQGGDARHGGGSFDKGRDGFSGCPGVLSGSGRQGSLKADGAVLPVFRLPLFSGGFRGFRGFQAACFGFGAA